MLFKFYPRDFGLRSVKARSALLSAEIAGDDTDISEKPEA